MIGDTALVPQPPKPKKKKCNAVAAVVMVVVAVVVTIFTAGAGAYLAAAAVEGTAMTVAGAASAGMSAVIAGGVAATATATGAAAAGTLGSGMALVYAAGAVVGSLASQAVGKAMGVVDQISWKQAAVAGLGGGIAVGLTDLAAGANSTLGNALNAVKDSNATWGQIGIAYSAQGVAGYMGSYVASKIVGLEASFSWKSMVASTLGSVIAGSVNENSGFRNSSIRGQVSAHSAAWMRDKWFGGGRPDYGQVAADAFGNTLADFMMRGMAETKETVENKSAAEQEAERRAEQRAASQATEGRTEADGLSGSATQGWMSPNDASSGALILRATEVQPTDLERISDKAEQLRQEQMVSLDLDVRNAEGVGRSVRKRKRGS